VVEDHTKPKYRVLASDHGYLKTLFNGGVIAQAKLTGHPVIVVEGPLDAAACVAAGLPLTVALCGAAYAHPEHFRGLQTVILALDADDAGQAGRWALWLALMSLGIQILVLPASALKGAKDLGEY
jgi:DNA primase